MIPALYPQNTEPMHPFPCKHPDCRPWSRKAEALTHHTIQKKIDKKQSKNNYNNRNNWSGGFLVLDLSLKVRN